MKKNKLLFIPLLLIPSFASLFSCNNDDNITIMLINEDAKKGIIGDGTIEKIIAKKDSFVKLEATPKKNYLFTGWYKVISDKEEIGEHFDNVYTFKATENVTLKAKWEDYSSQAFNFELIEDGLYKDTYRVSRYHGHETKIIVPATHHGRRVTAIAPETFIGITCNEIVVPEGINTLYTKAFNGCILTGEDACVKLPNSLEYTFELTFKGWDSNQIIAIHEDSIIDDRTKTRWGWDINYSDKRIGAQSTCSENDVAFKIY